MPRNGSAAEPALAWPHNLEAERAILGGIMILGSQQPAEAVSALDSVADKLVPNFFYHINHQKIYEAILALREDEKPLDEIHVLDWMSQAKTLHFLANGAADISSLTDGRPAVANLTYYADIVSSKARLRKLIKETQFIQNRALDGSWNVENLEEELKNSIESNALAPTNGNGNGNGHLGSSLIDFLNMEFPPQEHLIEGLIPRGASVMIVALPHRMKSFFTTGLALAATVATDKAMGKLEVKRPVKTMLVQVEDPDAAMQKRVRDFMGTSQFMNCDQANVWIIKRSDFTGFTPQWCKKLVKQALEFKADLIILDVLRRIFEGHGDLNSPADTSKFLEMIDAMRDVTGAAIVLVHHENKKDADLMNAAAGSYNFPGWANVMIQFKRKTMTGNVSHVEIEVDNKLGPSVDPMRMILDLASTQPVRLEALEDGDGLANAIEEMDTEWNIRTLMEVMNISRTSAQRRIKAWLTQHLIRKVSGGKKGRGGLAMYTASGVSEDL